MSGNVWLEVTTAEGVLLAKSMARIVLKPDGLSFEPQWGEQISEVTGIPKFITVIQDGKVWRRVEFTTVEPVFKDETIFNYSFNLKVNWNEL